MREREKPKWPLKGKRKVSEAAADHMSVGQSDRVMGKGFNCLPLDRPVPSSKWQVDTQQHTQRVYAHTHTHSYTCRAKHKKKAGEIVGAKLKGHP